MVPLLLGIIYILAKRRQERDIELNDAYRFYTRAIMFKVLMGLALAGVYAFVYGGGDTINFWTDAQSLTALLFVDFNCYLDILLGNLTKSNFFCFTWETGRPIYYLKDPQSFMIPRLISLPYLLTIRAFFGCTVLIAWIAFGGVWRLYIVFAEEYPSIKKELAICFLFMPSVVFWGSGILKDTFTFTAVCWMTYAVYNLLIKRTNTSWSIVYLIVSGWLLISIKPYIFVALLPGTVIWVVFKRIQGVGNPVVRILVAPIILMIGAVGASFVFSQASSNLGDYGDVDTMLNKAVVTQNDLKQEYYGGNTFDIGAFEPTVPGVLSKAPIAIFSGLFRPMLWEAKSTFMLVTAIENTAVLLFFIFMVFKVGPLRYVSGTLSEPMSMFGFVFAIFFSFAVGLTTANFGSLVRYKIPAMPFFLASIFIARERYRLKSEGEERIKEENDTAIYSG
ncbi:MAG: hypothetical protein K9J06_14410 [Flavobacteriales bacterium]|nr:hypothetical protein [Flavobacteriales bacterium]